MTIIAAPRHDGLAALCVFDGPINGLSFKVYVEQILVVMLKPGDIIIMDNLGSHKSNMVRHAIRSAGACLWFLLPYPPDPSWKVVVGKTEGYQSRFSKGIANLTT